MPPRSPPPGRRVSGRAAMVATRTIGNAERSSRGAPVVTTTATAAATKAKASDCRSENVITAAPRFRRLPA